MSDRNFTDDELAQFSDDRLLYELQMFAILAGVLGGGHAAEDWLRNALLESFTLHVRNLLDFFYPADPAGGMTARQFFADAGAGLPAISPLLEQARARARRQLLPLGTGDSQEVAAQQAWNVLQIEAELRALAEAFIQLSSPARLHPHVAAFVSNWVHGEAGH